METKERQKGGQHRRNNGREIDHKLKEIEKDLKTPAPSSKSNTNLHNTTKGGTTNVRKRSLDKKWRKVAWLVTYLENNQDSWRKHHQKEKHPELTEIGTTKSEWDNKTREEKIMLIKTSHQRAEKGESPKSRRTRQVIKQKIAAQREHLMEQGANNTRPGDEDTLTH